MHRLILLRHAKAEAATSQNDHARELVEEGRGAARQAARWLVENDARPDLVLCSTAARTRSTWDEIGEVFAADVGVVFEERLYDAEADAVLALLAETQEDVGELIVIGHNPSLEVIAARLSNDGTHRAIATAGILVFDIESVWRDIGSGTAALGAAFKPSASGAPS